MDRLLNDYLCELVKVLFLNVVFFRMSEFFLVEISKWGLLERGF